MSIAVGMNGMMMTVTNIVAGVNEMMMTVMNIVEGMKDMSTGTADPDGMTIIAITIDDTHMMIDSHSKPLI
ncbi:hypothetical protein [Candidatus Electrothrix sp.]|uniref:hypothetical protein n=1 Tax=Candidatus Electrothrix sp. TaxID=2170559 RepID=UPI004055C4A0